MKSVLEHIKSFDLVNLKTFREYFLDYPKSQLLLNIERQERILFFMITSGRISDDSYKKIEETILEYDYRFKHYYTILHKINRQITLLDNNQKSMPNEIENKKLEMKKSIE